MADPFAYFETIIANRAALLSEEEALAGGTLLSIETQGEQAAAHVYDWIHDHFDQFLSLLRHLSHRDQELLLSYFLLSKTQGQLGPLHLLTQTGISFNLRMAVKHLLTYRLLGDLTEEVMREILVGANLEYPELALAREPSYRKSAADGSPATANLYPTKSNQKVKVPLSRLVWEYAQCRNFQRIAEIHRLHRPDVRRAMSRASQALLKMQGREHALGSYIHRLTDHADPVGAGSSLRRRRRTARVLMLTEPAITGQFRIDVRDPDFKRHAFVSRAEGAREV